MHRTLLHALLAAGLAGCLAAGRADAQEMPGRPLPGRPAPTPPPAAARADDKKPAEPKPEYALPEKVTPTPCCWPHYRQFRIPGVHKCAVPTNTPSYIGYYVGGGGVCFGHPPCHDQGTWGWDYSGCCFM